MRFLALGALIALALSLLYIIILKLQMRLVRRELEQNLDPSYNKQISLPLLDRSLNSLSAEINRSLDCQRRLKLDAVRAENNLKQSVSDIAHDLRTPMTVIKGDLQLLEQEKLSPQGRDYLATCREKADALKEMADAFFELSVLESDSSPALIQKVNLTKVLMQFIADSEASIRLNGLEPELIFPEKTVYIRADEQMLMRMLGNVLNNIIKYADGSFRLAVEEDGNCCTIRFSNPVREGQMPDTELMFERSYRADSSRNGGSAGLGLFIVRLLAEKQSASVSAFSEENVLTLELTFQVRDNIS
jgi:signal transduction histidine kinase